MGNKKKLQINCALCDARHVSEEILSSYESVSINAATLVNSPASQELLGRHNVSANCANSIQVEGEVRFSYINGPLTLTAGQAVPEEKLVVVVNGPLTLEPGCEEVLRGYAGMTINGPVTCPASLAGLLGGYRINGPVRTYPDGAIPLKSTLTLDRVFHLRAKQDALYYAFSRIVALAPGIAFDKLAEKNVRFITKKLLVAESLAEAAVPLFDEKTDIVIRPDGCAYVDDDAQLNGNLLKRYGGKLYVNGDLIVAPEAGEALDRLEYAQVNGDLLVCRSLRDRVLEMDVTYKDLLVVGGRLIIGRNCAEVSASMLAEAEEGLSPVGCGTVQILADVTAELLREKLVSVAACGPVFCASEEQMRVVQAAALDDVPVSVLSSHEDAEEEEEDPDTVCINAATYAF